MRIVDPVTDLIEIARVTSAKSTSSKNAHTFKNTWSSQCPKQDKVVADNGMEFSGNKWKLMLMDWGICKGRISSHIPTANAVVESSHRVISQILCTTLRGTAVRTNAELEVAFDDACAIATCVMCCVSNTGSQGMAPGTLAFGCDMNINVPVLTDVVVISANRQLPTDACPMHENQ